MPRENSSGELPDDWGEYLTTDRADKALRLAIEANDLKAASAAARIILCSGAYTDEDKKLASRYNNDHDIAHLRMV